MGGALAAADGGALATKSADLDAASGVLQRPDGGSLAVTGATMRVGALDDSAESCEEPMDDAQERRHRLLFERTHKARRGRAHDPARDHHHHRTLEALATACTYRQGAWRTSYGHTAGGAGDATIAEGSKITYKTAMMAPAGGRVE